MEMMRWALYGIMLATGKPEHATEREWQAFVWRRRDRLYLEEISDRLGVSRTGARQLVDRTESLCRLRCGLTGGADGAAP